ncbi:glycerol-3-phosphate 1-O-acyltransferase PlsY [Metamycoplasma neophronis]|uniref:Glycerol-3-phosphate acyltransferase n=1 Tax=Metamycoplasma neophronis TaxID=872983 RepID=A0ABY2YZT5_9BACT|nr:glycerol-3-phosphate 1-O-acyltransferase PlsY [Metamycoplasma neophronis]TPR53877.1 glycerol-3-phosphate 1-O-acyltransferase PlsY [Metamycoplasma neophronis]
MFDWKYIWINIIIFILGYLIGSINIGILLSKAKGRDLREFGSKNAGATNALRTYGLGFATAVFIFDILKAYIPILIAFIVKFAIQDKFILPLMAGAGAMFGHIFPLYFKFKGGKGVACFFGMVLAFDFGIFLIFVMVYISIVLISRYVSLASAITAGTIPFLGFIPQIYSENALAFMQFYTPYPSQAIILVACAILIILKHIPNYVRLSMHKESKISFIKKSAK